MAIQHRNEIVQVGFSEPIEQRSMRIILLCNKGKYISSRIDSQCSIKISNDYTIINRITLSLWSVNQWSQGSRWSLTNTSFYSILIINHNTPKFHHSPIPVILDNDWIDIVAIISYLWIQMFEKLCLSDVDQWNEYRRWSRSMIVWKYNYRFWSDWRIQWRREFDFASMINAQSLLFLQEIGRVCGILKGLYQSRMNSRIIISISLTIFVVNNLGEAQSAEHSNRWTLFLQNFFSLIIITKSMRIKVKHVRDNLTVCQ